MEAASLQRATEHRHVVGPHSQTQRERPQIYPGIPILNSFLLKPYNCAAFRKLAPGPRRVSVEPGLRLTRGRCLAFGRLPHCPASPTGVLHNHGCTCTSAWTHPPSSRHPLLGAMLPDGMWPCIGLGPCVMCWDDIQCTCLCVGQGGLPYVLLPLSAQTRSSHYVAKSYTPSVGLGPPQLFPPSPLRCGSGARWCALDSRVLALRHTEQG